MPRFFLPVTVVRVWVIGFSRSGLPVGGPIVAQKAHFIQLLIGHEPDLKQKSQHLSGGISHYVGFYGSVFWG